MTSIWPNPRAAEATTRIDEATIEPNSIEVIRGYLAHAQVMIGIGIFQLATIVQRSGGDAVSDIDYNKFPDAYNFVMFSIFASAIIMLAIFAVAGWI